MGLRTARSRQMTHPLCAPAPSPSHGRHHPRIHPDRRDIRRRDSRLRARGPPRAPQEGPTGTAVVKRSTPSGVLTPLSRQEHRHVRIHNALVREAVPHGQPHLPQVLLRGVPPAQGRLRPTRDGHRELRHDVQHHPPRGADPRLPRLRPDHQEALRPRQAEGRLGAHAQDGRVHAHTHQVGALRRRDRPALHEDQADIADPEPRDPEGGGGAPGLRRDGRRGVHAPPRPGARGMQGRADDGKGVREGPHRPAGGDRRRQVHR